MELSRAEPNRGGLNRGRSSNWDEPNRTEPNRAGTGGSARAGARIGPNRAGRVNQLGHTELSRTGPRGGGERNKCWNRTVPRGEGQKRWNRAEPNRAGGEGGGE